MREFSDRQARWAIAVVVALIVAAGHLDVGVLP